MTDPTIKAEQAFAFKLMHDEDVKRSIAVEKKITQCTNHNVISDLASEHIGIQKLKIFYDHEKRIKNVKIIRSREFVETIGLLNIDNLMIRQPTNNWQVEYNKAFLERFNILEKEYIKSKDDTKWNDFIDRYIK
jgi:hypothetical protein